jgi:hypothetical protein
VAELAGSVLLAVAVALSPVAPVAPGVVPLPGAPGVPGFPVWVTVIAVENAVKVPTAAATAIKILIRFRPTESDILSLRTRQSPFTAHEADNRSRTDHIGA